MPRSGARTGRAIRITGYVMAADPAWIRASVSSYYAIVDQLVVSYDADGLGWTGDPIPVAECLDAIRAVDHQRKVLLLPGAFWRPGYSPMANDTNQRQASLDVAGQGAEWVLQIDTDEILLDEAAFVSALHDADENRRDGLEYPARWLYATVSSGRYLEQSSRFGRLAAGYPGPVAVRPGVTLRVARQGPDALWRVDFRARNTDPSHQPGTRVDAVVAPRSGIAHMSWVRREDEMRAKARSSSHAYDFDWDRAIDRWRRHQRHPRLAALMTPFRRGGVSRWLRLSRIDLPAEAKQTEQEMLAR